MGEFTHFNQHGDAIMVDISKKAETAREAIAEGRSVKSRKHRKR